MGLFKLCPIDINMTFYIINVFNSKDDITLTKQEVHYYEKPAYQSACFLIQNNVVWWADVFDNGSEANIYAKEINECIKVKDYKAAYDLYSHAFFMELDFICNASPIEIVAVPCNQPEVPAILNFFHHYPVFPHDKDEDQILEEFDKTSGATCRSCNNHSEYAIPDCKELTYDCYSCKTLQKVFS